MLDFLKREWIGGLSLLVALAGLFGTGFKFTPVVIGLFVFGGLWTAVVVGHALHDGAHQSGPYLADVAAPTRSSRPPRPTAAERTAYDLITDDLGRPTLGELRRALKEAQGQGKDLLTRIQYAQENPYRGESDQHLQIQFAKWAGSWPMHLNEYAPALYNVFKKRGMGESRSPLKTVYDLEDETKESLKMLAKVRRSLWWASIKQRVRR